MKPNLHQDKIPSAFVYLSDILFTAAKLSMKMTLVSAEYFANARKLSMSAFATD